MNKAMRYNINAISARIQKDFNQALKKSGTCKLNDKKVDEVIDIKPWVEEIKALDKLSASELFNKIINHKNKKSLELAKVLFNSCDNMPENWLKYVLSNSEI